MMQPQNIRVLILLTLFLLSAGINVVQYNENQRLREELGLAINISVRYMDELTEWYIFGTKLQASPYKVNICDDCFIKDIVSAMYLIRDKGGKVSIVNLDYKTKKPIYLKPLIELHGNNGSITATSRMKAIVYLANGTVVDKITFNLNNMSQYAIVAPENISINNVLISNNHIFGYNESTYCGSRCRIEKKNNVLNIMVLGLIPMHERRL